MRTYNTTRKKSVLWKFGSGLNDHGMGLIEVLIALGIMSIAFLGITALVSSTTMGNRDSRIRTEATILAQDKMDEVIHKFNDNDKNNDPTDKDENPVTGHAPFRRLTVINATSHDPLKRVTVTVSWGNANQSVQLVSLVADEDQ